MALLQTLALLQRAMEDESERATTTHEGIRQLLAATGLLPRNVATAEWARFGIASFFETPHEAFYPGTALPSWTYLISFKYLRATNRLTEDRGKDILLNVITDRYFRQAYADQARLAEDKDNKQLQQKVHEELEMARATAWALTYYLMNRELDSFLGYLQEVSNLPRDVEYDANVLQGCFARAVGMLPDTTSSPNQLDMQKLQRLANRCFELLASTPIEIDGIEQAALQARAQEEALSATPPGAPKIGQ
jgi:hypothetical protein